MQCKLVIHGRYLAEHFHNFGASESNARRILSFLKTLIEGLEASQLWKCSVGLLLEKIKAATWKKELPT